MGSLGNRYAAGLMGHSSGGATAFMHAAQLGSIPAVWVIEPGPIKTISSESCCCTCPLAVKWQYRANSCWNFHACHCKDAAWHLLSAASCVFLHLVLLVRELPAVACDDVASTAMDQYNGCDLLKGL